jgi:hypothetical protein
VYSSTPSTSNSFSSSPDGRALSGAAAGSGSGAERYLRSDSPGRIRGALSRGAETAGSRSAEDAEGGAGWELAPRSDLELAWEPERASEPGTASEFEPASGIDPASEFGLLGSAYFDSGMPRPRLRRRRERRPRRSSPRPSPRPSPLPSPRAGAERSGEARAAEAGGTAAGAMVEASSDGATAGAGVVVGCVVGYVVGGKPAAGDCVACCEPACCCPA